MVDEIDEANAGYGVVASNLLKGSQCWSDTEPVQRERFYIPRGIYGLIYCPTSVPCVVIFINHYSLPKKYINTRSFIMYKIIITLSLTSMRNFLDMWHARQFKTMLNTVLSPEPSCFFSVPRFLQGTLPFASMLLSNSQIRT